VRSSLVVMQFGEILRSFELPVEWREAIAERCKDVSSTEDNEQERIRQRRMELDAEHKRLTNLYRKGYITEEDLEEQIEEIRAELFALPVPIMRDTKSVVEAALSAAETLERVADYWNEAMPEERRDIVWSLLNAEGLIYDLERHVIVGLHPRIGVLPALALGLEATEMWEQHGDELWLRSDYLPAKRDVGASRPPGPPSSLTPAQQERAIMLIRQGMSLRKIAELLKTSYQSVYRIAKKEGLLLQHGKKLTSEQQQEALELLQADMPFREVARRFGVNHETVRQLALREGVELRPKGQKLTPTQRKLTPMQIQEARDLLGSGMSLRQVASHLGIGRQTLQRLLTREEGQ
jgi:transposase-like protein